MYEFLSDSQNLNSYSYVKNNPLIAVDPNGEWVQYIIGEKNAVRLGNWAQKQYDNNSVARYAMDNPYQVGAAIGLAGGALVAGGVVAGGGAITCGVLCGGSAATVTATAARTATAVGSQADRVGGVANGLRSGQNVPSLGRVIENAPGKITGFNHDGTFHGIDQVISRGLSPQVLQNTVQNPLARFAGRYDRTGYLSRDAYVVLDKVGQVVTSWSKNEFGATIKNVLNMIKK